MKKTYTILFTALIAIILDQVSKFLIASSFFYGEQKVLINGILSLTKIFNSGAAFSILQNQTPLLILISTAIALGLIIYLIKKLNTLNIQLVIGWGLILGGTIGNLIDRIIFGYVLDFIKLDFIDFPIFNLADLSINFGVIIILVYTLKSAMEKTNG